MNSTPRLCRTADNTWVRRACRATFAPLDVHRALQAPRWSTPIDAFADARDSRYDWLRALDRM